MATILVVDDSPVDRHRVAGLLGKRPEWAVVQAAGGEEALVALGRATPDAVLTDLRMPGMNGLELVEAIKAKAPALPVILMTAYGSEDIAMLALQRGAASYVPKRNLGRQLLETVSTILDVTQASRAGQRVLGCLERAEFYFRLGNDPSVIPPLVVYLRENLLGLQLCDENEAIRVGMALREALTNAVYHGNLELGRVAEQGEEAFDRLAAERSGKPPYRDRRVHLTVDESRDEAVYAVRDEGPGFDPAALPDPRDPALMERAGDRGLTLIRTFMDEVRHNAAGNEITLVKRRSP